MNDYAALLDRYGTILLHAPTRARWREAPPVERDPLTPWADEIEALAQSFLSKRVEELRRAIPLTLRVAPRLLDHYQHWLSEHPADADPGVLSPGLAEGLRAEPALRRVLVSDPRAVEYAADLLRFELYRGASRLDRVVRNLRAHAPLHTLVESLAAGVVPVEPEPEVWLYQLSDRVRWRREGDRGVR